MTDAFEEIKAEAYLEARGWARIPPSLIGEGAEEAWFRPGAEAGKRFTLKSAVTRQLRSDVIGFVYMLENLDARRRPGTRKIVGALITMMVSDILKEFWEDSRTRVGMMEDVAAKLRDSIPRLFEDRSFRDAIEAIRQLWHVHGKVVEKKDRGEGEKPN